MIYLQDISAPRSLSSLMTEVYKCLNGLLPDIMNDAFAVSKHQYSTGHYDLFVTDKPKAERYWSRFDSIWS